MIDKRTLNMENENNQKEKSKENEKDNCPLPDYINFLVILDWSFPKNPPKILSKTKVNYIKITKYISFAFLL
jgi:hypothetical protein